MSIASVPPQNGYTLIKRKRLHNRVVTMWYKYVHHQIVETWMIYVDDIKTSKVHDECIADTHFENAVRLIEIRNLTTTV